MRQHKRLSGDGSAMLGAATRSATQAVFLLAIPISVSADAGAQILTMFSLNAILVPAALLGSQFHLIRGVVLADDTLVRRARSAYVAAPILGVAAIALVFFYRPGGAQFSFLPICTLLLLSAIRLVADSHAQAVGQFGANQMAYAAFWAVKAAVLLSLGSTAHQLTFSQYAVLELLVSMPWLIRTARLVRSLHLTPREVRVSSDDAHVVTAGLIRNYWLEADKLLLPLVLSTSTFVDYAVVSRSTIGAMLLVSAFLSARTPQLVAGDSHTPLIVVRDGRRVAAFAVGAHLLVVAAVFILYPRLVSGYWIMALIASALPLLFLLSSAYADYAFYHFGPGWRLAINAMGAGVATCGTFLVVFWEEMWLPVLSLCFSLGITGLYGMSLVARSRIVK